jgi:hypothetical protein
MGHYQKGFILHKRPALLHQMANLCYVNLKNAHGQAESMGAKTLQVLQQTKCLKDLMKPVRLVNSDLN